MPLDDETKQRLREAAAAKRGRTNLKGLDRTTGLVGFDYVQEREDQLPALRIDGDGHVEVRPEPDPTWHDASFMKKNNWGFTYQHKVQLTRFCTRGPLPNEYTWVALRHTAEWIPAEFAARWPDRTRRIQVWKFAGPGNPRKQETLTAIRAPLVLAWFQFLWPREADWAERAERYWVAYSTRYTVRFPGVGQRIRLAPGSPDHHQFPPGEDVVVTVAEWNGDRTLIRDAAGTGGWTTLGNATHSIV